MEPHSENFVKRRQCGKFVQNIISETYCSQINQKKKSHTALSSDVHIPFFPFGLNTVTDRRVFSGPEGITS